MVGLIAAPELTTARLSLARLTPADAADVAVLHADPRVAAQLLDGVPQTPEHAHIFIEWAAAHYAHGYGTFAARRLNDGVFIGLFSLVPMEASGELELGGKLARAGWGRGLALEAGAALTAHAFGALGRDSLVSAIHPENRAARAVLLQLGFAPAGEADVFGSPALLYRLRRSGWAGPLAGRKR